MACQTGTPVAAGTGSAASEEESDEGAIRSPVEVEGNDAGLVLEAHENRPEVSPTRQSQRYRESRPGGRSAVMTTPL